MIGGRDQQQNELVVKRYLNEGTRVECPDGVACFELMFLWCSQEMCMSMLIYMEQQVW